MRPDDWQVTDDLHDFLSRAGGFLHSRPALHTVPLTVTDALRTRGLHVYGTQAPLFGLLGEGDGEVRAIFLHTPPHQLNVTPLRAEEAEALVTYLLRLGHPLPGVSAERDTARAFAAAWGRSAGVSTDLHQRQRLYRLAELTVPEPVPAGRARVAGAGDRELVRSWFEEFCTDTTGQASFVSSAEWTDARLAHHGVTLWETPEGTPVSMAAVTPKVASQVRVAPVYTPADLRGRGYAGAVTAEISRVAVRAGADGVLLFTDLSNPTSNGLYQRIGYRGVADFAVYEFGGGGGARQ